MNILFVLILFFCAQELCEKLLSFQNLAVYMEKYEAEKIFKKIIDEGIYNLRAPQDDGSFKYAYLSMENPEELNFSFELEKFPFSWKKNEENIFSIEIYIPKKKNIFWGNEDAYLKEVILKLEGFEKVIERDKILKKGETYKYPLNKIYKNFEVSLLFEKMEDKGRSSYVEVHLFKAGLKDDPKNPDYKLLKSLVELKKAVFGSNYFNENLNYCLENCKNSFKRELLFILYLLKGNQKEQLEGIERLEKLLNQIK